eukprot:CAMPEP_0172210762 /NCGR_PEP_ID=MMETSP1050-20130122/35978_1 /TAXON_ID=233186 /ORGANISM="Cryptomonas curvata, Strain CCAP979/52" /LENGTH=47 /DNA_ID= /DNA_START= /DNA_END= /DNA_ORIENTATION=
MAFLIVEGASCQAPVRAPLSPASLASLAHLAWNESAWRADPSVQTTP